jgi:eukaryotic-like serine/threonine-protein kinase
MKKSHILLIIIFIGLTLLMSACVPGPRVTGSPGLSIADDAVYVAYGNFVFSLDATSGNINWGYPEKASNKVIFYAPPLVTENSVYIGDLANDFHKLDRSSGQEQWVFTGAKGFYLGQAAEMNGVVYAPNNDGSLYAIGDDGGLLWSFVTRHYLWSQPQVTEGRIYIGSMDHFVYAISTSGEEIWSTELSGAVTGAPLLNKDGSILYAGSLGNQMYALDTNSGEPIWTFDAEQSVWGTSILVDGNLLFSDDSGTIYALDAETGTTVWQTEYVGNIVGGLTSIGDGFVITTKEGVIKAYDFEGNPIWESSLDGEIYQAPVAGSDFLIAGTIKGDNLVYGFNLTGVQLWSTTPEK